MKVYSPLTDLNSVLPVLSSISFLGGISQDQLTRMLPFFEALECAKGVYIARQGEEPSHIYIIREGLVRLEITVGSHTLSKRTFETGDCFGEAAMFSMINHTASFVAEEQCKLIALSNRALNRIRKVDSELFCQLMVNLARDLARKLQYTDELLVR